MDEVTQRRLIGAAVLFLLVFGIASLLPDRARESDEDAIAADPGTAPKVVVYDLNSAPARPANQDQPVEPVSGNPLPARTVTPVLSLDETMPSTGNSLGWYVQLGSYSSPATAQAALAQATASGFSGAVQRTLKEKKKLYRARIGPFTSQDEAKQAQQSVAGLGFTDARLIEVWKQ